MDVTSALLEDFKQLVEEHGISGDTIIINQNNGTEQKNRRREQGIWGSGLITADCVSLSSQVNVFPKEQVNKDEAQRRRGEQ